MYTKWRTIILVQVLSNRLWIYNKGQISFINESQLRVNFCDGSLGKQSCFQVSFQKRSRRIDLFKCVNLRKLFDILIGKCSFSPKFVNNVSPVLTEYIWKSKWATSRLPEQKSNWKLMSFKCLMSTWVVQGMCVKVEGVDLRSKNCTSICCRIAAFRAAKS